MYYLLSFKHKFWLLNDVSVCFTVLDFEIIDMSQNFIIPYRYRLK